MFGLFKKKFFDPDIALKKVTHVLDQADKYFEFAQERQQNNSLTNKTAEIYARKLLDMAFVTLSDYAEAHELEMCKWGEKDENYFTYRQVKSAANLFQQYALLFND